MRSHRICLKIITTLLSFGLSTSVFAVPLPFSVYTPDTVQICLADNSGNTLNIQIFSTGYSGTGGKGSLSCTLTIPYSSCPNESYKRFLDKLTQMQSPWHEVTCTQAPTQSCAILGYQSSLCATGYIAACSDKPLPAEINTALSDSMSSACVWQNGMIATAVLVTIFGAAFLIVGGIFVVSKCSK